MEGVDWPALFAKYDTNHDASMDAKEFAFFVQDLLNLQASDPDSDPGPESEQPPQIIRVEASIDAIVSYEEAKAVAQELWKHPSFGLSGPGPSSRFITLEQLRHAALSGAFATFQPSLFMYLSSEPATSGLSDSDELETKSPRLLLRTLSEQEARKQAAHLIRREIKRTTSIQLSQTVAEVGSSESEDIPPVIEESSVDTTVRCQICLGYYEPVELYGCAFPMTRKCICDVQVCITCLRYHARSQIRSAQLPSCPGRILDSNGAETNCRKPLGQALLAMLFERPDECILCDESPNSLTNPLIGFECAFDHMFCASCLHRSIFKAMQYRHLPRCPRSAECKFTCDESSLRSVLTVSMPLQPNSNRMTGPATEEAFSTEVGDTIVAWRDLCILVASDAHPLKKPCSTPDCHGFLSATKAIDRSSEPMEIKCSACHISYCWRCVSRFHYGVTCANALNIRATWASFLQSLADSSDVGNGISSALLKLEQSAADASYFRQNIVSGNMKRCPQCKKLIEKRGGCPAMVCGEDAEGGNTQSGCGYRFQWDSVPNLTVAGEMAENGALASTVISTLPFELNATDVHVDLTSINGDTPPIALRCSECHKEIVGTSFSCINCPSRPNLCMSCVRRHLNSEDTSSVHHEHVFECVSPPKPPASKAVVLRAEVQPTGIISVFGLATLPPGTYTSYDANLGTDAIVGFDDDRGFHHNAVMPHTHWSTAVLVEVHPDGRIVYADNHGVGARWLSLDSIAIKIDGRGKCTDVALNNDYFAPLTPLRPPALIHSGTANILYGQVDLIAAPPPNPTPTVNPVVIRLVGSRIRLSSLHLTGDILSASRENVDSRRKKVAFIKRTSFVPNHPASSSSEWVVESVDSATTSILSQAGATVAQTIQVRLRNVLTGGYLYAPDHFIPEPYRPVTIWLDIPNADVLSKSIFDLEILAIEPQLDVRLRSTHHNSKRTPTDSISEYLHTTAVDLDVHTRDVRIWKHAPTADVLTRARFLCEVLVPGPDIPALLHPLGSTMIGTIENADGAKPRVAQTAIAVAFISDPTNASANGGVYSGIALNHITFKSVQQLVAASISGGSAAARPCTDNIDPNGLRCTIEGDLVFLFGMATVDDLRSFQLPFVANPETVVDLLVLCDDGHDCGAQGTARVAINPSGVLTRLELHLHGARRLYFNGARFRKQRSASMCTNLPLGPIVTEIETQGVYSGPKWFAQNACCYLVGKVQRLPAAPANITRTAAASHASGCFAPGDLIGRLPSGMWPVVKCAFMVLAGSAPPFPAYVSSTD